jgi:hypothetical protein
MDENAMTRLCPGPKRAAKRLNEKLVPDGPGRPVIRLWRATCHGRPVSLPSCSARRRRHDEICAHRLPQGHGPRELRRTIAVVQGGWDRMTELG